MTQGEWCLTPSSGWGGRIRTGYCQKGQVDGPFKYDRETRQIQDTRTGSCVTVDTDASSNVLTMRKCDPNDALQKWEWTEKYSN
jgi:hypothetical protein